MKFVNLKQAFLLLFFTTIFFTSCEGLKILTLTNRTGKEITYETKPELPSFGKHAIGDTLNKLSASKIHTLKPDSTAVLFIRFEGLLFNLKIREADLTFDYLKINTSNYTIVANNRTKIIQLIESGKTRYIRRLDKNYALRGSRNMRAIVVR